MAADICERPWEFAVEPFRIAGNLYYVGNRDVSCHLIDCGVGLILIDTAFPQTLYLLLESIRRLGFDPRQIAYVLHSHAHYDHCGGTRALVELTGAKAALGREDIDIIERQHHLTWAPQYGMPFFETFKTDIPLSDGDAITLGNTRIECVATPGHTPGTISYFFEVAEGGRSLTVGLHGGPGLNTLTDQYMRQEGIPLSRRRDYLASLGRLRERTVDVHIGAHPAQTRTLEKHAQRTGDVNPFVDPESWPRFLDDLEQRAREAW